MGAFIDTQQALLSEEKQKRIEREEKQRIKKKQEEAERNLFYKLDIILENKACKYFICKTTQGTYKYLLKYKDNIIFDITKDENILYFLDRKYIKILNDTYKKYQAIKIIDKQKQMQATKEEAEATKSAELRLFKTLRNTLSLQEYHNKFKDYYFKNVNEAYYFLLDNTNKDYIINLISNGNLKTIYFLNKKYITILNNLYKPYKLTEKQQQTPKKENKTTHKKTTKQQKRKQFIFKIYCNISGDSSRSN